MLLCPLDYAFPTMDENITKTYTNNVFNYVESNTNSVNDTINKKSVENVNSVEQMRTLHKQEYCPYCKKNNYSNFYKSNSIDLITITALSFLFFSIIKGR